VALQGTLDTFALADVLRLLASTGKSGCLHVSGSRGSGQVWLGGGAVVAAQTVAPLVTTQPVEVLCELLRSADGEFSFEAGAIAEEPGAPADVEPMLAEAEQLAAEWIEIEQVVPSMDAWVSLVEELPKAKLSVDAASWRVIIAVAGGSTVRDIGTWMGVGELAVSRGVCGLVKIGLATVTDAPAVIEPTAIEPVEPVEPVEQVEAEPFSPFVRDEPVATGSTEWEHTPPWADESQWVQDPGYLSFTPQPTPAPVYEEIADPDPEPQTLAEALPEVPDTLEDDVAEPTAALGPEAPAPIDRSRLLKFLGSVGK
jgi:hypothetical protein